MDRIDKALRHFSSKERKMALELLRRVKVDDLDGLNVKKLRGYPDVFRVRAGVMRIIFQRNEKGTNILSLSRRDEGTYRDF